MQNIWRSFVPTIEGFVALEIVEACVGGFYELGYCSGNMHWRVAFAGSVLRIAVNGPKADYLARLAPLIEAGRVKEVSDG